MATGARRLAHPYTVTLWFDDRTGWRWEHRQGRTMTWWRWEGVSAWTLVQDPTKMDVAFGHEKPLFEPQEPIVMYEPYEAARIQECLADWGSDEVERAAARGALVQLCSAHSTGGSSAEDKGLRNMERLRSALVKLEVRHTIVKALDKHLPPADSSGCRSNRVKYIFKAGGAEEGRAWADVQWTEFLDGKLRCLTLQGLPGDLRGKLTGAYLTDFDGCCSDFSIYVMLATEAALPESATAEARKYLVGRSGWHRSVAKSYCGKAGWLTTEALLADLELKIKRWPNAIGNGSGHGKLLDMAGFPATCKLDVSKVQPMMTELRALKCALLSAPCYAEFVARHRARLSQRHPGITQFKLDSKVFSLLVSTREHTIMAESVEATRDHVRSHLGPGIFDALPIEKRNSGALIFDGHMAQLSVGIDAAEVVKIVNSKLAARRWKCRLRIPSVAPLNRRDLQDLMLPRFSDLLDVLRDFSK